MKALATFIMRGRLQAALMTTVFAVLSMILPPFSYLSGAVVALTALRSGAFEGLAVSGIAALFVGALSQVTLGTPLMAGVFVLVVWAPIVLLSAILRKTVSMPLTLSVVGMLGLAVVALIHLLLGDPVAWWQELLNRMSEVLMQEPVQFDTMLGSTAQIMTAVMVSAFLLSLVVSLFIGRWWQATLYNPGGFGQEFRSLRLDKTGVIVGVLVLIAALTVGGVGSMVADMGAVVFTLYSVAGMGLIHDWAVKSGASMIWLLGLYLLLLFLPQFLLLLALLAMADSWLDLRRYIKTKA